MTSYTVRLRHKEKLANYVHRKKAMYEQRVGQDSVVGTATRYGLDGPEIETRWGARLSAPVQTGPGAHPATYTMRTGLFPGIKWPGHGVDHPPPSSAEVKERVELYLYPLSEPS